MSESRRSVLVAGAQGVTGRAAAEHFSSLPATKVYGLSRRMLEEIPNVVAINVDLLWPEDVERAIAPLKDITHIVFAAFVEKETPGERSAVNVSLLRNLLDVADKNASGLRHVTLYQGGKAYGADLGPFKTPAREDDPRLMGPNFYYDQEDFLKDRQSGRPWHYTILRPEAVSGFAVGKTPLSFPASDQGICRCLRHVCAAVTDLGSFGNLLCRPFPTTCGNIHSSKELCSLSKPP